MSSPGVVIVNQAFARRYLNGQAVGRRITPRLDEARPDWEIVGVVADAHMRMVQDPPQPELFVSYRQIARGLNSDPLIVLRTVRDPAAFAPSLRQALREVEPSIALDSVMTMEQRLTGTLARPRLYAIVLAATALFAVVIAAVGLFGSLSYSVAQRAKEIGVRTALGARPLDIITLIVGQTMRVTALGLALGIAAALVASRALTTFLYGVAPHDPATFIIVAVAIVLVAALACVVPARRAAKLDPLPLVKSSG